MLAPFARRDDRKAVENALAFAPKFDADGLIVAIATDWKTHEVLMVAYMNEATLRRTLEIGEAVYYSRSRQEEWHKGATSGHVQIVHEILTDCDQDALVLKVEQKGPGCCHNGYRSCFYRRAPLASPAEGIYPLESAAEPTFDAAKVYHKA
jgi:phosphoribosyl-AMP cyclohydrolase